MNRLVLLLTVVAVCVLPLALGAESVLLAGLPGGLPLGTLLAALALVAGAAVPLTASRPRSLLRWAGGAGLVAAALWLPLGVYLSGNPALNFVSDASGSVLFWELTAGVAGFVVVTIVWACVAAALARRLQPASPL